MRIIAANVSANISRKNGSTSLDGSSAGLVAASVGGDVADGVGVMICGPKSISLTVLRIAEVRGLLEGSNLQFGMEVEDDPTLLL